MADTGFNPPPAPATWGEAFAMLPAAAAPDDAWARIAARLPAPGAAVPRHARRRWRPVFALAASLALALPVASWLASRDDAAAPPDIRAASGVATVEADRAVRSTSAPTVPSTAPVADAPAPTGDDAGRDGIAPVRRAVAAAPAVRHERGPVRAAVPGPRAPRAQSTHVTAATTTGAPAAAIAGTDAPLVDAPDTLQRLRGESARLEALVAWARDDRMASGAATVMTAALDDRLRLIDAALSQSGLAEPERASLWSQRVDALQELATLEGTRRWMAVHGTNLDAVARVD